MFSMNCEFLIRREEINNKVSTRPSDVNYVTASYFQIFSTKGWLLLAHKHKSTYANAVRC